jgi:hypothetical protein
MRVRTTIQPDVVLEVTDQEADALRFQGLLIDDPYTGEIPAARVPAQKNEEDE